MKKTVKISLLLVLAISIFSCNKEEKEDTKGEDNLGHLKATIYAPDARAYFFTDIKYYKYDVIGSTLEKTANISSFGSQLPENFDAAFLCDNDKQTYFFKDAYYYKYDFSEAKVIISGVTGEHGWKGVPANIDAAVSHPNGYSYFFKGDKYYRYSHTSKKVDKVAPITNWKGLPASNLDAALYSTDNGYLYFFKGNTFYKYDANTGVKNTGMIGVDDFDELSFSNE